MISFWMDSPLELILLFEPNQADGEADSVSSSWDVALGILAKSWMSLNEKRPQLNAISFLAVL